MEHKPIYRILNQEFGWITDNDSLNDFDIFMERFGESISGEIMSCIWNSMKCDAENIPGKGSWDYKININLEKCEQFETYVGEYLE